MGALVYHQIIRFGEASLAEFAHEFALWSHFTTEIRPTVVIFNSHYRKHFGRFFFLKLSRVLLSWVLAVVGVHLVSRPIDRVQSTKSGYTWMCVECVSPLSRRFFCLLFLDEFLAQSLRSLGVFVLVHLFYFAWTANWGGRRSCQSNKYSENIFKFSGILETSLRVFLQSFLNFSLQLPIHCVQFFTNIFCTIQHPSYFHTLFSLPRFFFCSFSVVVRAQLSSVMSIVLDRTNQIKSIVCHHTHFGVGSVGCVSFFSAYSLFIFSSRFSWKRSTLGLACGYYDVVINIIILYFFKIYLTSERFCAYRYYD